MNPADANGDWSWWQRALFRFGFVFWTKFCLQIGLLWDVFGWASWIQRWILRWPEWVLDWPTDLLTRYFTFHVFHLSGEAAVRHPTGSGDTAQDWVGALALLVFAITGALLWTAISEWRGRRNDYRVLYAWLRLAMRFALAGILLSYGFSKVFPLQFPAPLASTLVEPYGQSSPMGLLWTFMGASPAYEVFAGLAEVVPAVLLLFRRTSTLGALAACTVLLNVVMLNFCYDVPVKLYSSLYLMMALFLLLPNAAALWSFFVAQRDAKLTGVPVPAPERRALRLAGHGLQVLVIGHMLWISAESSWSTWRKAPAQAAATAPRKTTPNGIDGSWVVDSVSSWPPGREWKFVTIGSTRYRGVDYVKVADADGMTWFYPVSTDLQSHIHFMSLGDTELTWSVDADGEATLDGRWKGQPARLTMQTLRTAAAEPFPLMTRGFHWVQELPYSR